MTNGLSTINNWPTSIGGHAVVVHLRLLLREMAGVTVAAAEGMETVEDAGVREIAHLRDQDRTPNGSEIETETSITVRSPRSNYCPTPRLVSSQHGKQR